MCFPMLFNMKIRDNDAQKPGQGTRLLFFVALVIGAFQFFHSGRADPPPPPTEPGIFLNAWHFNDTNFLSFWGDPPKAAAGLSLTASWEVNAVKILTTNSLLQYREIETNGVTTNIVCQNGTIYLWFLPNWNSGTGSGNYGRLLEMGSYTTNASIGWWSLYTDPKGTNIFFSGQTNGAGATFLTSSVSLNSNQWTFLALTYSPTNSFLYTNGTLCSTGLGSVYFPSPGVRGSNGFCVGGSLASQNLALGRFEWLRTYNYPLSANWVSNFYQAALVTYGGGSRPLGPLGGGCVTNVPVFLTNVVSSYDSIHGWTVTFSILGGTNAATPYDLFSTSTLAGNNITNSQWTWLGQGYTCNSYTFTNEPNTQAFFVVGDATIDPDGDGLSTAFERLVSKSDPTKADSDGDGLRDDWEFLWGTDPWHDDAVQSGQRTNYAYDPAGRLKQVTGKRTETLTIDGEGNVLSVSQ